MNWLLYALLGPAVLGINNLVDKFVLNKFIKETGAFTIMYGIASFVISVILLLIFGFHPIPLFSLFLIFCSGIIQIIVLLSYFKAIAKGEASRVIPLFQMIPVFALLLGFIFLKDVITGIDLIGFVFVFIGGFFLSVKRFDKKILTIDQSFWLMLLASLGSASIGVIFKFVALPNNFWQVLFWENLGIASGASILGLMPSYRNEFIHTIKIVPTKVYGIIAINELIFFFGRLSLRSAFVIAPVALVQVISGVQPLFILLYVLFLSRFFPDIIHEKNSVRELIKKLVFILLILIGVILIATSN